MSKLGQSLIKAAKEALTYANRKKHKAITHMREDVESETKNAIRDQISFITNSCFLYDKGCQEEAIRIAGVLNVLLETRRNGSRGLLRVIPHNFNLLSSVPDVEEVDANRLVVSSVKIDSQLNSEIDKHKKIIKDNHKFLLVYVDETKNWYLYGFTQSGREIQSLVTELNISLGKPNQRIPIDYWIANFCDNSNNIMETGKKIIIRILSVLFGYENRYVSGLYFPMVRTNFGEDSPTLTHTVEKYLTLDAWLNEIIYSISDTDHENYTLTRKNLIESARDQDGGSHFDITLRIMGYYKSKYGEKLAEIDGKDITTKNYHLIMLRQLGYEILNSPILEILNKKE